MCIRDRNNDYETAEIEFNNICIKHPEFADNWMPILEWGSEFSAKWASLSDSQVNEGIRAVSYTHL